MANTYPYRLKTLILALGAVLLGLSPAKSVRAATGIFANSVTLNSKGGGNTTYRLLTATPFNDSQPALPASLGTFQTSETLVLAGGQVWTFKNSGGNVTGATVRYRVYSCTASGSYTDVGLAFGANIGGGGDQRWELFSNTTNLIAPGGTPLAEGDYTLEIIGVASTNEGSRETTSYTTTFTVGPLRQTVQAGSWNAPATWGGTVPPTGARVQINHNVTLNQAATVTSLAVTAGTFTASDGSARLLTVAPCGSLTVSSGATFALADGTLAFGGGGTLTNGGTLNANTGVISFGGTNAGTFTNNGTYAAGTATVLFFAGGTIGGSTNTTFNNVTLAGGGVNFGANSTVNGILRLNTGGFVNTNAPNYAASSTLAYATGQGPATPYGRGTEWSATSGKGYPANVLMTNSTSVDLGNGGAGVLRQCAGSLTIDAGSNLFMDFGANDMTQPLVVVGNIAISGTLVLSDAGGGDLKVQGNLSRLSGGSFIPKGRAVFFDGSAMQTVQAPAAGNFGFDYIVNNNTSTTGVRLLSNASATAQADGNAITLSGNLDLNGNTLTVVPKGSPANNLDTRNILVNTSQRTISSSTGTGVLVLPRHITVAPGSGGTLLIASTVRVQTGGSGIGPINFGGVTTIDGILELLSGVFVDGTSGNGPQYGVNSTLRYNIGGGYARRSEWDGSTTLRTPVNVEVTGTGTYLNLDVANASVGPINLRGNLNVSTGATVDANNNTDAFVVDGFVTSDGTLILSTATGGDLKVGGNFTNTGTFTSNGRAIFFTGANTQAVSSNTALAINYIVVAKTAGQVNLASGTTLTVSAPAGGTAIDFNTTAGPNILNLNGQTLTIGATGVASNAGTIPANSGFADNGSGTLNVLGGTVGAGGDFGIIRFISGTSLGTLNVNRTNGSAGATIRGAVTINTNVTFGSSTKLTLVNEDLTLAAAASLTGITTTRYFVTSGTGQLARQGMGTGGTTTAVLFPVGTATTYNPATVTNTGTQDVYRVRVSATSQYTPPYPARQISRFWQVDEAVAGGSTVTLALQWNGTEEGMQFVRAAPLRFTRNAGGGYTTRAATLTQNTDPYVAQSTGITLLSEWSVGNENVLPAELAAFTARMDGADAQLNWRTASEKNNQLFDVERSLDAVRFERIGSLPGQGTTALAHDYTFRDRQVARFGVKVVYYRLRQQDFSGEQVYSKVIAVNLDDAAGTSPVFWPNPLADNAAWTLQCFAPAVTALKVVVTDARGAVVYRAQVSLEKGYNYLTQTQLPGIGALPRGLYVLRLEAPGAAFTTQKLERL